MRPVPSYHEPKHSGHKPIEPVRRAAGLGSSSLDLPEVLENVLERVRGAIAYDTADIVLLNGTSANLAIGWGHEEPGVTERVRFDVRDVPALQTMLKTLQPLIVADVRTDPNWNTLPAGNVRSWLAGPLVVGNRVTGFICLGRSCPRSYAAEHAALLLSLTEPIAIAIENASLYDQVCRRAAELRTINEIGRHLTSMLDPQELFERAVCLIQGTFDHYAVSIWLLEEGRLRLAAVAGELADSLKEANPVPESGHGIIWAAAEEGVPVLVPDVSADARYLFWDGLPRTASELAVPIRLEDCTLGVLDVESDTRNAYDQNDVELLTILADQLAAAVRTTRLYERERTKHRVADTLGRTSAVLGSTLNRTELLRLILEQLSQVIHCTTCSILLREGEALRIVAVRGWPEGEAALGHLFSLEDARLSAEVLAKKTPSVVTDVHKRDGWTRPGIGEHVRAWIGAPLMVKGEAVGLLCVDNSEPEAYTKTDGELVMAFANHAALAIENARLYADAQRRLRQLAALQEVSLEVGDSLELPTVLDAVAGSALRLVDAGDVHIFLYDDAGDELRFGTGMMRGGELLAEPVQSPRPAGVTYTVAQTGKPVVANDLAHHPLFGPAKADWGMEAIVGLPIKHGGHVVGVLTAACVTPHVFTAEEVSVLELLAERAAAAIEHARLYDEARRRLRQVEALQEVSFKVGDSLDLPAVLDAVVGSVLHLVDADDVHICLYDAESDTLQFGAGIAQGGTRLNKPVVPTRRYGVTHTVARSGAPLVINQPHHHRLFTDSGEYETLQALVGLPLKHGGRVLGVLIAACANPHTFTADEVGVLELFADRAATAIKHAQLVDQLRDSERRARQLNEELGERLTELGRAQTRLVQSEKMAAVGQLVSGVAHELNNPLTTILGYSQLLVDGHETPDEIHDDAERIFNAAARSAEVVRSLLKFSRRQKPERILTDVNEAVEEALSLRRYQFRVEGVDLVCDLDSSVPPVIANPHRLQEVILNLVINGEQAMVDAHGSGRLVVRTRAHPGVVRIEVEDSGPGIPEEIVDHIFEPFFTTKEVGRGTGLGLSICYGIVEEHGGRIWVETRQGDEVHGSNFIVELPTDGEESGETGQHPETSGKGLAL